MADHTPKIGIIILNWNSYEVTQDCLLSLRKLDYPDFEVVVVDNGSIEPSADKMVEGFPEIRLIKNRTNLGFTGGNNVGIRDVLSRNPDYLLLLNNDTVVAPNFLTELVQVAESDAKIGMLNPKIYFFEPADRIWYAGGMHKPWWSFPKHLGLHKRDDGKYNQTREVSFVTGCALLIKAPVVREIGLLDEMFFHSFEDADWSLRAFHAGFKAFYVPTAVIWHRDAYDTRKHAGKDFKDFYNIRNSILFARKHLQGPYWPLFLLSLGRWLAYRTIGYLLQREFKRVKALYKGIWSGCSTKISQGDTKTCIKGVAGP
jgi:GT2 family glycosyltransferase